MNRTVTAPAIAGGRPRRGARSARIIAEGLMALLCIGIVLPAGSASASTTTSSRGYPGATSLAPAYGGWSGGAYTGSAYINAGAGTAYRSRAYKAYDQYVCATTRLYQLMNNANGTSTWTRVSLGKACGWIRSGQSYINLSTNTFWNPDQWIGYGVDVRLTWQLSNGSVIGSRTVDFDSTSDYQCGVSSCSVGYNSNGAGAFIAFYAV